MSGNESDDSDSEYSDVSESEEESGVDESSCETADDDEESATEDYVMTDQETFELVTTLVNNDSCPQNCLAGKARELEAFIASVAKMTAAERKCSVFTALAILSMSNLPERQRGRGERQRAHIADRLLVAGDHPNTGNENAKTIDVAWLSSWFQKFAELLGEVVPVRVRRQKKENGKVVKTVSSEDHLLLPSYFTWRRLHEEMQLSVAASGVRRTEPSESAFRKILMRACPHIQIRSPRDNVCDSCVIYRNKMINADVTEVAELLGNDRSSPYAVSGIEDQCVFQWSLRIILFSIISEEYKTDCGTASETHTVLTMDYAQNLCLPHVAETPSQWYFLSLVSVSVFGVHSTNDQQQTNFLYTERKGGKGPNEVVSMLRQLLNTQESDDKLTLYADNCGGQNKNNFVIKFFLLLAHVGYYKSISYKFFVRGHTKNACDRGFGTMKKRLARYDCWNLGQLRDSLEGLSAASQTVMLDDTDKPFSNYKDVLNEIYKNLPAVQKYQVFSMDRDSPGVVECRVSPDSPGVVECRVSPDSPPERFDLRRTYDGIRVSSERALELLDGVPTLPNPPLNAEKIRDIHANVKPYVSAAFHDDIFYESPSEEQVVASQAIKKKRAAQRAANKRTTEGAVDPEAIARGQDLQAAAVMQRVQEMQEARASKKQKAAAKKNRTEGS